MVAAGEGRHVPAKFQDVTRNRTCKARFIRIRVQDASRPLVIESMRKLVLYSMIHDIPALYVCL